MLSGTNVKSDGVHDRLIERRHLTRSQILRAQKTVGRASSNACEEFALGIGPSIVFSSSDVYGARGNQGNQFVGIDRKPVGMITIFLEVAVEPVRKGVNQIDNSLAIVAARERGSALTGTTGK